MLFYEIQVKVKENQWFNETEDKSCKYDVILDFREKCEEFEEKHKNTIVWINTIKGNYIMFNVIANCETDIEEYVSGFLDDLKIEKKGNVNIKECSLRKISEYIKKGESNAFLEDRQDVYNKMNIEDPFYRFGSGNITECFSKKITEEEAYNESVDGMVDCSMAPEIKRIFEGRALDVKCGSPVQYMFLTNNKDERNICNLMNSLYSNKVLISSRFVICDIDPEEFDNRENNALKLYYQMGKGSAIVIKFQEPIDEENDTANASRDTIEKICNTVKKYRRDVLTVFVFPRDCNRIKSTFFEYLFGMSFVEITDNYVDSKQVHHYFKHMAEKSGIRINERLLEKIDYEKKYYKEEMETIFYEWYDSELKISIYPQYKNIAVIGTKDIEKKPKGNAYERLSEMIGLDEAKKIIHRAVKYHKAQTILADKGRRKERPCMHMVFTGHPGTAKTTVARLFAEIMKENELLSSGHLVEVGRGDLVGKYVGWTAPTIKRKFDEARGGVLFIDEAYSLVDDRSGSYGDEAINTIVQEMENHRDDMSVIFAGYPKEMEEFLQRNPGLKSRIAFQVPFDDYNAEELCDIAKLMAKDKGMTLSEGAIGRLKENFEVASTHDDFGNGRYVRNLMEKAKMAQAVRIIDKDIEKMSDKELFTILEEDIEIQERKDGDKIRRIGFAV